MKSFALVVCRNKETGPSDGFVSRILRKLPVMLRGGKVDDWAHRINLYDGVEACVIKIPYNAAEIKGRLERRLSKLISEFCGRNNISDCYFPKELKGIEPIGDKENVSDKKFLFKSILPNILEAIYSNNGISLKDLDIVIIQGQNKEEPLTVIKLLCESVRFITVLSDNKESLSGDLNEIYNDSGLSVGTTSDFINGLRNADVVINLGTLPKAVRNFKCKSGMLFINLSGADMSDIPAGCTVINGVEVKPPAEVMMKLDEDIKGCFGMTELAEIILGVKYGCYWKNVLDLQDFSLIRDLSRDFTGNGWKITAFRGRHSFLSLKYVKENIQKKQK